MPQKQSLPDQVLVAANSRSLRWQILLSFGTSSKLPRLHRPRCVSATSRQGLVRIDVAANELLENLALFPASRLFLAVILQPEAQNEGGARHSTSREAMW